MTTPTPVLVVADDLTGANATGARFARAGLRSATVTSASLSGPVEGFDALIVSTASRHLDADDAAARVRHAVEAVPGAELVVKRVDTTLRGNVSAETAAILDAVRATRPGERVRGLVVPAYPTSGRVTIDGMQLLDGKPLEQTELRHDVHNPMTTSSVATIVNAQTSLSHRLVTLGSVLGDDLEAELAAGDEDLVVCDALEDEHIQRIAEAAANVARSTGIRWVSVDPGPAGAFLAQALELGHGISEAPPLLAVVGSVTDLSIRQVEYLARSELVSIVDVDAVHLAGEDGTITAADAVRETGERIAEALSGVRFPRQILVRTLPPGATTTALSAEGREHLPRLVAEALLVAIDRAPISGLYSSGGDITAAILDAAAVEAFEVVGEVIPLAVYGRAIGGTLDGLPVVTKGGLIGTDVTGEACMNQLRTLAEGRIPHGTNHPTSTDHPTSTEQATSKETP